MNAWQRIALAPILLLVLFSVLRIASAEQTFYVSPQGNDSWSGTLNAPNAERSDGPWATLEGARNAVRQVQQSQAQDKAQLPQPVVVSLRAGTYPMTRPLRFSAQDSGTRAAPITYRAYPGEQPTIDGGRPITGWRQEGQLWVTEIEDVRAGNWMFSSLWADGRRCQPARTPNPAHPWGDDPAPGDTFHAAGPVPDPPAPETSKPQAKGPNSKTRFRFQPGDLRKSETLDDAVVVVYHSWATSLLRIKNLDEENHIVERNIVYFNNGQLLGSTWKNGHWTIDHNCYWDSTGKPLQFAGRTWEQWRSEGHDTDSLEADPRLVAPERGDFHVRADSPALSLGFVPWEYDQAGLYGEPEWVERAKRGGISTG